MGLEAEIVQDVVIEEGGATEGAAEEKAYNPTNPIFEVAKEAPEGEKKEEAKLEAKEAPKPEEKKEDPIPKGVS